MTMSDGMLKLLSDWEEALAQGRELAPKDLCPNDARLQEELRRRIDRRKLLHHLLAQPKTEDDSILPRFHPPQYVILERLGQGGMGVVYRARQEQPRRQVALKMIRPDRMTERAVRRFEHEFHILGRLQHPGIARIYEVGSTPTPIGPLYYYAMELIAGRPITAYAREEKLNDREKVELMIRVCDAVHFAHQKEVVHRDLKPDNILTVRLRPEDRAGQPKILDFGLAKATEPGDELAMSLTEGDYVPGTIQYMSPEQAAGRRDEIDTRTDVYALGLILYQLLTGRHAINLTGLGQPQQLQAMATEPATPLRQVRPELKGDLDTIVGKALERERTRRYESALEFAKDLQRYLDDQPIQARPPSALYLIGKYSRRNKLLVGSVMAVGLALIGAIGALLYGMDRRNRQIESDLAAEKSRTEAQAARLESQQSEAKRLQAETHAARERDVMTSAGAVRLALSQGQWEAALTSLDQLQSTLSQFPPGNAPNLDLGEFRLGRVAALDGLNRSEEARQELAAIQNEVKRDSLHLSAAQFARLLIKESEILSGSGPENNKRADELVEQAIAAGLDGAELEYARGLISSTGAESIQHLRNAVKLSPVHHRARLTLAFSLIMSGHGEEAEEVLAIAEAFFPKDVNVDLLRISRFLLQGDFARARSWVDPGRSKMDDRLRDAMLSVISLVERLATSVIPADGNEAKNLTSLIWETTQSFVKIQSGLQADALTVFQNPPKFIRFYTTAFSRAVSSSADIVLKIVLKNVLGVEAAPPGKVDELLDQAIDANEERIALLLRGKSAFGQGKFQEAERYLDRAIVSPSLGFPNIAMERSLEVLMAVDYDLLQKAGLGPFPNDSPPPRHQTPADQDAIRALKGRVRNHLTVYREQTTPRGDFACYAASLYGIIGEPAHAIAVLREADSLDPGHGMIELLLDQFEAHQGDPAAMLRLASRLDSERYQRDAAKLWRFRANARWSELSPAKAGDPPREMPADPFAL